MTLCTQREGKITRSEAGKMSMRDTVVTALASSHRSACPCFLLWRSSSTANHPDCRNQGFPELHPSFFLLAKRLRSPGPSWLNH